MEDTIQLNSARHLPQNYRRVFEKHLLSHHINDDKQDEEVELNHDSESKSFEDIIHELSMLSLDQKDLLDLLARIITKMNSYLSGSKKLVSNFIKYYHKRKFSLTYADAFFYKL